MLELPGLLGYAVPPLGILKLPSYRVPLISASMFAVGGFVRAVFVCKFACAFRVCSAGVARVFFGVGCDHSAPATMINGEYRPQYASVIKHNQSALGDKPAT